LHSILVLYGYVMHGVGGIIIENIEETSLGSSL